MCCFVPLKKLQAKPKSSGKIFSHQELACCFLLTSMLTWTAHQLSFWYEIQESGRKRMLIWFGWDKPSCCIVQFGHTAVLLLQVWRAAGMSPDLS